ncbi:MAG: hypothetical protein ACOH2E_00385 [Candidatus Paracaedibacter sp.]
MNKKILLTAAIVIPSLAIGGLWLYQASQFEKSISQQVSLMQETLKTYGISFQYDDLHVSRYLFKAHLVNPKISGALDRLSENMKSVKALEGIEKLADLKGELLVKGEIAACFSPISNVVTIKADGETQLNVQGPVEFNLTMPKPKESSFVIQRKDYDFSGKNPFISVQNIKGIYAESKGVSLFLDGQKFLDIKDTSSQISLDWEDKVFDISISSDTHQMQIFKIEKGISGKLEGLDSFNTNMLSELEMQAILGAQDQKISASFHLNDLLNYINDIKLIFASDPNKFSPQIFEKLIPEGMLFDVKDYSIENKIYQSSLKMSGGRLNGRFPIKLSGDFKVTDQWPSYWQDYFKIMLKNINSIIASAQADEKLSDELTSLLNNKDIAVACMPQLQSFGKMLFSLDFDIPATLTEGKGSVAFKSDLYELNASGVLKEEGGSLTLKTQNASSMMVDFENYVTRVSQHITQIYPLEVQNFKGFVRGGRRVLDKILEPSGAVQQSVNVQLNKEGIKIGNYDLMQILGMFGEAINTVDPQS